MKEIELSLISKTPTSNPTVPEAHIQNHTKQGQFLKSFLYGGLDGTFNILTIIFSAYAINLPNNILIAVSLSATIGDAIGMGLGDYVSYESQQQYVLSQRKRQEYEFQEMREEEMAEMTSLLKDLSYSQEDSEKLTELYATNSTTFINLMMMTELGLVVNNVKAWQVGLVNFSSFLVAGTIPLLPYLLFYNSQSDNLIIWSGIIGVVQLFSFGYVKGIITNGDKQAKRRSGLEVLIMGVIVTIIGSYLGSLFGQ